ncbi:SPOR domain-containing protein [Qipengyuania sp. XHP0207]|uniref:SPOR domain-containing protein n=1 Tax=Qipengyuania sp. XHP0207 TaxID=3038078 RepID=UPI00241F7BA8|nr:SPOR domain-containing protein [Qipengyuania sp. XHP0207]MDG5749332.1 SPOR domain-containing protein [Qipengyuania sp. XHP0207]
MRRVNPPEDDRALLRTGEAAPLRMTTPDGLLSSLRKRLPGMGASPPPNARQATSGGVVPAAGTIEPIDPETEAPAAGGLVNEPTVDVPLAGRIDGSIVENSLSVMMPERPTGFVVQIGAFSLVDNANRLADRVGGFVMRSGPFHLVRIGPFASREKAREALAKLRGQGYSDALIQNID